MSNRKLVLVLLVVMAVPTAWFALWSGRGEQTEAVDQNLRGVNTSEGAQPALARPERADKASRRELVGPDSGVAIARTIFGSVVVPSGTPEDEELYVLLHGIRVQTDADGQRVWISAVRDMLDPPVLGRTRVADDGTFRLDLPAALERAWVQLQGRYLVGSTEIPLGDEAAEDHIEVRAVLGGGIRIALHAPDDLMDEAWALVGRQVEMEHLPKERDFMGSAPRVTARIKEDLTATFLGIPADRSCSVWWEFAPFAPAQLRDLSITPGEIRTVDLALELGRQISGLVIDEAGDSVAGARACVCWGEKTKRGSWSCYDYTTTDAEGRFRFGAVSPLLKNLRISKDGFHALKIPREEIDRLADAGEFVLTVAEW